MLIVKSIVYVNNIIITLTIFL